MKKEYECPEIELIEFDDLDILLSSDQYLEDDENGGGFVY